MTDRGILQKEISSADIFYRREHDQANSMSRDDGSGKYMGW